MSGGNLSTFNGMVGIFPRSVNDISPPPANPSFTPIDDLQFWVVQTNALPAPTGLDLASASDLGISNTDNLTGAETLTFTATALNAQIATLYVDEGVNGRAIDSAPMPGAPGWTITVDADDILNGETSGTFDLFVMSGHSDGRTSPRSATLRVTLDRDVAEPTVTLLSDAVTNSPRIDLRVQSEQRAALEITAPPETPKVIISHAANGTGDITRTLDLQDTAPDRDYVLNVKVTNTAGFTRDFTSHTVTLDTAAPTVESASLLNQPDSDSGVSQTDGITNVLRPRIRADLGGDPQQARLLLGSTPVTDWTNLTGTSWISGIPERDLATGTGDVTVTVQARDAAGNIGTRDYTYTYLAPLPLDAAHSVIVQNGDPASPWITQDTATLTIFKPNTLANHRDYRISGPGVPFTDIQTLTRIDIPFSGFAEGPAIEASSFSAEDRAGNPIGILLTPASIIVDLTPPAIPTVALVDDTGTRPDDLIINQSQPDITIQGVETGVTLRVQSNSGFDQTVTLTQGVAQTLKLTGMVGGTPTLTLTATDPAGNEATGTFGPLIIDRHAPTGATTKISSHPGSDSGVSQTDAITNVARPVIEARATDAVQGRMKAPYTTDWTDMTGLDWIHNASQDLSGTYTVELRDAAGNIAEVDGSYTYYPNDLSVNNLRFATGWQTGTSGSLTNLTSLTVQYDTAGLIRPLFIDQGPLTGKAATAPTAGSFGYAAGSFELSGLDHNTLVNLNALRVVDQAGNVLPINITGPAQLTVDTQAPAAPAFELVNNTSIDPDSVYINQRTPRLRVTALPENTGVRWRVSGRYGQVDLTAVGQEFDLSQLPETSFTQHTVSLTAVDDAGNTNGSAAPVVFFMDTVAPAAPAARVATNPASDTGTSSFDQITNNPRPSIRIGNTNGMFQLRLRKGADIGPWAAAHPSGGAITLPAPNFDLNGAYTVEVQDEAGNTTTADFTYTYLPPLADTDANRLTLSHAGTGGDPEWTNLPYVPLTVTNPTGRAFEATFAGNPAPPRSR